MTTLPTVWLAARASGMVAYGFLTLSVLAGLMLKSRPFGTRVSGATAMEIHRSLSLMGVLALAIHGLMLVADDAVTITLSDLVVPGAAPYRPLWTAFGVVAAELMVLLIVSFRLRKVIGRRAWRNLHWASYLTFAFATVHGVFAGTDSSQAWARAIYIGAVAAVIGATTFRIVDGPVSRANRAASRRPAIQPAAAPAATTDGAGRERVGSAVPANP